MVKYIDAGELYKRLIKRKYPRDRTTPRGVTYNAAISDALRDVQDAPPADVVELRHGRWTTGRVRGSLTDICSVCGCDSGTIYHYNYCPNCGAKMVNEDE